MEASVKYPNTPGSDKHRLEVLSLNDARARCTCGGWTYSCTGFASEFHMRHQFQYHLQAMGLDPQLAFAGAK